MRIEEFTLAPAREPAATGKNLITVWLVIIILVFGIIVNFITKEDKKDDQKMADVYTKAGATVHDMDEASFNEWRELARQSSFKDFVEKVKNGQALLDMATAVK